MTKARKTPFVPELCEYGHVWNGVFQVFIVA